MAKSSHIAIARQKRSMREARQLKEIMARQRTGLIPGDGIVPGDEAPANPTDDYTCPGGHIRDYHYSRRTSHSSPDDFARCSCAARQHQLSSPSKINDSYKGTAVLYLTALPSESGSTSTGALAGGVIGGIALLALLSFGIVYYMRRFQKRKQTIAFEASSFRRSAILLDDSKSETKSNGGASSSPMQEKYISHADHAFAPQFQFPTNATKASVYGDTGYDQQGYLRGQGNNVRLDTALPPPPVATSASPWGTAALVSAAAYGNSAYGMNSAPSPYSPYSQKHTQPDQQPPPSPMSAISYLPNPYADNDRDNMQTTQTLSRQPSPPSTVMPSSQPRNNAQQAVATDRKRPDTVYSTIYNPEDAYGGF
ncbi:hypothetical protein PLEOSDRAFT_1084339 [Pleurotus ostreatus PC15]|uniref:Uncharacterized protein n=1 Tax=Pleurotus ostreatus (strain PC15) TaxID=1137138 RepID=A0A067NEJ3_PLEO1|nr:hypothetical protein PLEOSDRAFT_1084339 [Pleurotus ostreatus PC15]